jgi:hypothetical protein
MDLGSDPPDGPGILCGFDDVFFHEQRQGRIPARPRCLTLKHRNQERVFRQLICQPGDVGTGKGRVDPFVQHDSSRHRPIPANIGQHRLAGQADAMWGGKRQQVALEAGDRTGIVRSEQGIDARDAVKGLCSVSEFGVASVEALIMAHNAQGGTLIKNNVPRTLYVCERYSVRVGALCA